MSEACGVTATGRERLRPAASAGCAGGSSSATPTRRSGCSSEARGPASLRRARRRRTADGGPRTPRARLERHYRARLREPVDPQLAVYAAYWFRGYACNPRAIYERARELAPDVRGVWVVKPQAADASRPGVEHVVADTPRVLRPDRPRGVLRQQRQLPRPPRQARGHACTCRPTTARRSSTWGSTSATRRSPAARMNFDALLRARRRAGTSASPQNPLLDADLGARLPRLVRVARGRLPAQRRAGHRHGRGRAARPRASSASSPGRPPCCTRRPTASTSRATCRCSTSRALADALGRDHVVLARLHYFYDADPLLRELHGAGRIRDVASHPSIEELCLAADVLVTDYSSIMFDYAVLDRPIVIHAPDWEVYRALRGAYFDLLAEPPGVVARTDEELSTRSPRAPRGARRRRARAPRSAPASARSTTAARPSASSGASGSSEREAASGAVPSRRAMSEPATGSSSSSSASAAAARACWPGILGPARLPHPAARGQGRRDEPARLRRAALGGRLPHPAAARSGA